VLPQNERKEEVRARSLKQTYSHKGCKNHEHVHHHDCKDHHNAHPGEDENAESGESLQEAKGTSFAAQNYTW